MYLSVSFQSYYQVLLKDDDVIASDHSLLDRALKNKTLPVLLTIQYVSGTFLIKVFLVNIEILPSRGEQRRQSSLLSKI
jgi:hypothetical protein